MAGIRATVEFPNSTICPITELSAAAGTTIDSVATNVCAGECTESVSEFSVETDEVLETDLTPVFAHGSTRRYRLSHDDDRECPCKCLGEFQCPTVRYVAQNGTLTVVFHATDYDQLQTVVGELTDRFPDADVKRFIRSPSDDPCDNVLVDRSKLTTRQAEVLGTAYEMGYFERPRGANATEVADEIGIAPATFTEHLAAAQRKLLADLL